MKRILLLLACFTLLGIAPSTQAQTPPTSPQRAIFAGGCFWCMQPPFDHAAGVISTLVGYAGGTQENPTYKQVSAGETSHRESIEVTYDPPKISYEKLLEIFWHNINPIRKTGPRKPSLVDNSVAEEAESLLAGYSEQKKPLGGYMALVGLLTLALGSGLASTASSEEDLP